MSKSHEAQTCFGAAEKTSQSIQEAAYTLGAKQPPSGSEAPAVALLWQEAKRRSGGGDDKALIRDIEALIWQLHAVSNGEDHADQALRFARTRIRVVLHGWKNQKGSSKPSRK